MKKRRQQQHPPYLDGRVASNSVSTRRSMRTSAGRFMQFFLCVMMLMAFSVQKASAYDDWQDSWISQWYDAENATIVLDIRVYQSWVEQEPAIADSVVMPVGLMSVWLDTTSISKVRKTSGQAMTLTQIRSRESTRNTYNGLVSEKLMATRYLISLRSPFR